MSIHINAKKGDIAEVVLLPGDPLRAKFIAETILEDAVCYTEVRGMYGYTGMYKGKRVSVQGTGMGMPSISIYTHELVVDYDVKKLVRIGTCGAFQEYINLRDVILPMSTSTNSNMNKRIFKGDDFAPTANFELLKSAYDLAKQKGFNIHVGSILTSDSFYDEDKDEWKKWAKFGVLGVEMETSALYTLASKYNIQALAILTVSDHVAKGDTTTSEERQKTFKQMIEIALEIV